MSYWGGLSEEKARGIVRKLGNINPPGEDVENSLDDFLLRPQSNTVHPAFWVINVLNYQSAAMCVGVHIGVKSRLKTIYLILAFVGLDTNSLLWSSHMPNQLVLFTVPHSVMLCRVTFQV